ncbi:tyrosine-type recombinase/integrase [Cellulomonas gilvus]|uniref:Integrase family protein n=1 Tax=Cellulomonas gilvus (strain ATCC 13127 / NRRL B-14078) TaxID=593907 RepID=F8A713_CELGA|nr:tyrosine-type recombinase/integrase [Cellulomonas gilvus]AEI12367.1 integrase family protein [Cellulomonas gilvus ATCC 13127]
MTATKSQNVATVLAVLASLGLDPADLLAAPPPATAREVLTVSEYLATVRIAASTKSLRTYASYWRKLEAFLGTRRLDAVTATDVEAFANHCQATAVKRANSTEGTGAARNARAAARFVWSRAVRDGLVVDDPAAKVKQVRRTPKLRRALDAAELDALATVATSSGDDVELDGLLVRFHWETGARRGGAISLTVGAIDADRSTVRLLEKGSKWREVPVTNALLTALLDHATERGGALTSTSPVFCLRPRRNGGHRPLTRRRYNTIAERWHKALPWAEALGVSMHWVRHTALTETERCAGEAVAALLAGHTGTTTTSGYTVATLAEVAEALHQRTGFRHPLCDCQSGGRAQSSVASAPRSASS